MGSILSKFVNDEWRHMPWKSWTPPSKVFAVMPSFAVIEWTYRLIFYMCLKHALTTKKNTLPILFSAFICGTFNDIFFMFLPLCDNFWQAQASVMITPRLPLYIIEMYAVIIYPATIAARQFNLPYIAEACLTGLFAHLTYHVYDINGPPNLWWTWHDGDPAISKRHHNAPIGSSLWILTYIALHSYLLRFTETPYALFPYIDSLKRLLVKLPENIQKKKVYELGLDMAMKVLGKIGSLQQVLNAAVRNYGQIAGWGMRITFAGLVCTPWFMQMMGVWQILSFDQLGVPGKKSYRFVILLYLFIVAKGFKEAKDSGALFLRKLKSTVEANKRLFKFMVLFYAVNYAIGKYSKSEHHLSTGVHQKFSDKSKKVKDIMFYTREDHIQPSGPVENSVRDYELITQNGNVLKHKTTVSTGDPNQTHKDRSNRDIIMPEVEGTNSEWYTVVGKERDNRESDTNMILIYSIIGSLGFSSAFFNVFSLPAYLP